MFGCAMQVQKEPEFLRHRCDRCNSGLFDYIDVEVVEQVAKEGCLFAKFALSCIHWIESKVLNNIRPDTLNISLDGRIMFCLPGMEDQWDRVMSFETLLVQNNPSRLTSIRGHDEMKLLPESTSADETFATINEWLTECVASHTDCLRPLKKIPEGHLQGIRFLLVRDESILLVPEAQPMTYAALSHCWGTGMDIIKTLEGNIKQHIENGIQLSALPKTFQDAVYICRRLNISYLWIDSLCIVQDDPVDWSDQASRMEDVYKYSFVTIAATKAQDPTQGCFSETHKSYRGEPLDELPDIIIRRVFQPARDFSLLHADKTNWPLCQRGWTYQELILSSRIVHFGMQEVMWNCATDGRKCQSMPKNLDISSKTENELRGFTNEIPALQWHNSVVVFSSRKLTFHKDRLPAIAAIAKRIQVIRPGDQYLAGLWRSTLFHDLLWYVLIRDISAECTRKDPAMYTSVPSWSWAFVSERVHWSRSHDYRPFQCVELLEAVYVTDGPTVSGPVLKASIKLKAPLIKLLLDPEFEIPPHTGVKTRTDREVRGLRLESDLKIAVTVCYWDVLDKRNTLQSMYYHGRTNDDITEFSQSERDVFLVPLSVDNEEDRATIGHRALMVESTSEANKYRRVGVAGIQSSRSDAFDDTEPASEWDGVGFKALRCIEPEYWERFIQEIEEMETHVITLI